MQFCIFSAYVQKLQKKKIYFLNLKKASVIQYDFRDEYEAGAWRTWQLKDSPDLGHSKSGSMWLLARQNYCGLIA